ncbi:hypothetical protein MPSEU_000218300 [Mayamaea pseudoterrestris]|nr:hypothetical protein MPSEU_000218300 [Mayamaea pseudoterrestris]
MDSSSESSTGDASGDEAAQVVAIPAARPRTAAVQLPVVRAAPPVNPTAATHLQSMPAAASSLVVHHNLATDSSLALRNLKKDQLLPPISKPQLELSLTSHQRQKQLLGHNVHYDQDDFHRQRTLFQAKGQATAPESSDLVQRTTLGYDAPRLAQFAKRDEERATRKRKLLDIASKAADDDVLVEHSDDEVTYGIWGPPSREQVHYQENLLSDIERGVALAPEQLAEREYIFERNRQRGIEQEETENSATSALERRLERNMAHLLPSHSSKQQAMEPSSTFHGSEQVDYKQRSWIAAPAGIGSLIEKSDHKCKVPRKCVSKMMHCDKGVHRIRLFPKSGHLLLSAGLDGTCRVWNVADNQLMRIYKGHSAGVRDVQFNSTGEQFVSASFDRYLRLWDTESGKVLQTFGNNKVPYCVEFYPLDDHYFVVGCSDNKIVAYNTETAEITQEYNHHLAPVNAILFVTGDEGGVKMISTGDDKKVLVWEWDIGVPIKYIMDPTMHSMPCLALHPDEQFFVGQSLDNTIVVFQANKKFAMQKKKKFSGHIVSGYACQMDFSPDGQYLVSGDGNGNVFLWDWKRHKILQKYKAHNQGPTSCCVWHPLDPSTMISCGWDGYIKVWQ